MSARPKESDEICLHRQLSRGAHADTSVPNFRRYAAWFTGWRKRPISERAREDMSLSAHIPAQARLCNFSYGRITDSQHGFPFAENLLGRDFVAPAPNQKWGLERLENLPVEGFSEQTGKTQGKRYQLYLDARRMVVSGDRHRSVFAESHRLGDK